MKRQNLLRLLAVWIVAGFLGACAHQEGLDSGMDLASEDSSFEPTLAADGELEPLPGGFDESAGVMAEGEAFVLNEGLHDAPMMEESAEAEAAPADAPPAAETAMIDPLAPPVEESAPVAEPIAQMEMEAPVAEPVAMREEAPAPVAEAPKPRVRRKAAPSRPLAAPTRPIERSGEYLNRYYVLRSGDGPDSLSELLFGSADKAADLRSWNPGRWNTGRMVYYLSPLQPGDGEMRSFYEERGMVPTEYHVRRGDTLASIALSTYGSVDSWREISLVNTLESPDRVEPGTRLALYPADLSDYSLKLEATRTAKKEEPAKQPSALDQQITTLEDQITKLEEDIRKELPAPAAEADKPVIQAGSAPSQLAAEGRARQKERAEQAELASPEVKGFVQQNLLLILTAVALFGAFALYFLLRKSRDDI